jgi:hypothetical protein
MATNLLTLDPALMQELATQPSSIAGRTRAELHQLQAKRDNNTKVSNKVTREQRRRDVTIKLLKPNEDALRKMRSLDVFNYFVVPYEMAKGVRASIHRESSVSSKKFTTAKFKWGQHHYLKVKRVPEHGGM